MAGCPNVAPIIFRVGLKEVIYGAIFGSLSGTDMKTGSSADNIVSHFAVNYHNEAQALGIDLNELYTALKADGEDNPFEWNTEGRQVNVYQYVFSLSGVNIKINF